MKHIAILFLFSLLLSSGHPLFARDEAYDAVYLSEIREYTLNPDGTMDYRYFKEQKLQNYRSFNRLFGETFIVYDPEYQNLTIDQCYTLMADGKKVIAPENAFNEVLPRFSAHAPAFNRLREMVVTHTGLEIGATICLDYRIHSAAGFFPALMGSVLLAEDQPVKAATVIIRIPENHPLFFRLFNSTEKPSEKTENGFRVYTWTFSEIPAITNEDHRPEDRALYPALLFSTLDKYEPLTGFLMNQDAFRYRTSEAMNQFVTELVPDPKEKNKLLFAIQDAVVKELNLFDIPEAYTGYRLRRPEEVWNSNGGTVAEKAVLLTAMLRQAGINADPVLVLNGSLFDGNIGTLTTLEEWVVRTDVEGIGETFLSVKQANAIDMTLLEAGNVFLILEGNNRHRMVIPKADTMTLTLNGVLVLDSAMTISGDLTGMLRGAANPALALSRSEDKLKHNLRGGLASAAIKGLKITRPAAGVTSFTGLVSKTGALKQDGGFFYFLVPFVSTGIDSWDFRTLYADRVSDVALPSPLDEVYDFTIAIPENLRLVSGEQDIRLENPAGVFVFRVKEKNAILQVHKKISIAKNGHSPVDYPALKELIDSWNLARTNTLIFTR